MKIQVGVFFGGRSVEHEVSVVSAMQAIAALDSARYDAVPVYMTKDGRLFTGDAFKNIASYRNIPRLIGGGTELLLRRMGDRVLYYGVSDEKLKGKPLGHIDLALPVVHGTHVEDGTLQGYLESLGLPYAGCDVLASALCMDKWVSKAVLNTAGVPVLPGVLLNSTDELDPAKLLPQWPFGYPVIVKPVNLGSSVGVAKASDDAELAEALSIAAQFSPRILVEPAVVALREINCAVLGDGSECRPSVCEEPIGSDAFLSYEDKYLSQGKQGGKGMSSAKRRIPADLTLDEQQSIQDMAVKAFAALGCSGVARIDFLMDTESGKIYVNEINTIPGSLSFYLWEATGLSFPKLLDELISLASARARRMKALTFTFDTNILSQVTLSGKTGGSK